MLELLAVICLVLIVMFVILYKNDTSNIVALLAIFSVAAFRLLPSFNRLENTPPNPPSFVWPVLIPSIKRSG